MRFSVLNAWVKLISKLGAGLCGLENKSVPIWLIEGERNRSDLARVGLIPPIHSHTYICAHFESTWTTYEVHSRG